MHSCIRVHTGKTKVWNRAGIKPLACDVLERIARIQHPSAVVWRGSDIPTVDQGIKVLGTPLGHPDYVTRHLQRVEQEQQTLLDRIPSVFDVQSAWLLLLHCASARANYQLRVVHPSAVEGFSRAHDAGLWQCLSSMSCTSIQPNAKRQSEMQQACHCLLEGLVAQCDSVTSSCVLGELVRLSPNDPSSESRCRCCSEEGFPMTPILGEAASTTRELVGVQGFEPPSWRALAAGERPPDREPEEFEPGTVK